jgi:hypothetical protein
MAGGIGKLGVEAVIRSSLDNGVNLDRKPRDRIMVSNEETEYSKTTMTYYGVVLQAGAHDDHCTYDEDAQIKVMLVLWDLKSVSSARRERLWWPVT